MVKDKDMPSTVGHYTLSSLCFAAADMHGTFVRFVNGMPKESGCLAICRHPIQAMSMLSVTARGCHVCPGARFKACYTAQPHVSGSRISKEETVVSESRLWCPDS